MEAKTRYTIREQPPPKDMPHQPVMFSIWDSLLNDHAEHDGCWLWHTKQDARRVLEELLKD